MAATPIRTLTALMQGSNVNGIVWANPSGTPPTYGSPFYGKQAPEPQAAFPYVTFYFAKSKIIHTQQGGDTGGAYEEQFEVVIEVHAETINVESVSAPMIPGSLFSFLDSYADSPSRLNGDNYECTQFTRTGYELEGPDELRAPDGFSRVWTARAEYDLWITTAYPIPRS